MATTTLLTTGLLCMIAAIVGGGVKALGGEMPVIQSPKRQFVLFLFGLALLVSAYRLQVVPPNVQKDSSSSDSIRDRPAAQEQVPSRSSPPTLDGTTWVGTASETENFVIDLKITFGRDDTAIVRRNPGLSIEGGNDSETSAMWRTSTVQWQGLTEKSNWIAVTIRTSTQAQTRGTAFITFTS